MGEKKRLRAAVSVLQPVPCPLAVQRVSDNEQVKRKKYHHSLDFFLPL